MPEPEAHDKVLDYNPDRIGIWKCCVLRRGENRSTRRKTYRSKLNPPMTPSPGNESGPHRWEASALTTVPSLLSKDRAVKDIALKQLTYHACSSSFRTPDSQAPRMGSE